MNQFDIPERAIVTFERIHQLSITVHDLTGSLNPCLKPYRFYHRSPLCLAVKAQGHLRSCLHFENKSLREDLPRLREGRMHICHAGLVEWVMPVFEKDKVICILFAGPRIPGKQLSSATRYQATRWAKSPWTKVLGFPSSVEEDEGQLILEHLRQLAARLQKWIRELKSRRFVDNKAEEVFGEILTTRQMTILRFIEERYAQPVTLSMLAEKLCLSESRTSHVVYQSCGTTFRELLIQKRLDAAMELLRQTGMTVLEVALASGFEDVAHFHRLFRRRIGTTPARCRISGQSSSPRTLSRTQPVA